MKKFERWNTKELAKVFHPLLGEEDNSILIGVRSRDPPSIVSSATSSNASVATTASTAALLERDKRIKNYLGKKDKIPTSVSQREINILLAEPKMGDLGKKCATKLSDMTADTSHQRSLGRAAIVKQVLAALAVSLGSMVVGFSSGFTAPALPGMTEPLQITPSDSSWIGSLMPLSAMFGGILGGPLLEIVGRRNTIILTGFPFIAAYLLIYYATNVGMVMAGRALTGLSVGISSLAYPVYLGETIEARVRGTLGLLPTSLGNLGILLAFSAGAVLDWRYLALTGALLPLPFLICTVLIPESPLWYISQGNDAKAEKALQWFRGKDADISTELRTILKSQKNNESGDLSSTLKDLFSKRNLKPFFICIGLMFFQQLSGINAVIFYTVDIFQDAGSTIDSNLCSIIVGIVNLCSTLLATVLIDRLGRKILMYVSESLMALSLGVLATFFYYKRMDYDMTQYGWLPLTAFVVYIFSFAIGAGPIPWLMMGEILPSKIRGAAASIATAFNWLGTFVVSKLFMDVKAMWGAHIPFAGFAFVCFIGLLFTIKYVPETQGKTLDEIEEQLTGKKMSIGSLRSPVRTVSLAALKPLPSMV